MTPTPEQQRLAAVKFVATLPKAFRDVDDMEGAAAIEDVLDQLEQSVPRAFSILQQNTIVQLRSQLEQAQARERGLLQALEEIAAMPRAPEAGWLMSTEAPQMAEEALAEALAAQSEGSESC